MQGVKGCGHFHLFLFHSLDSMFGLVSCRLFLFSCKWCLTLLQPHDCGLPGSSVYGVSQQEYWSGLPFPPPEDIPDPAIKPVTSALAGGFSTTEPRAKPTLCGLEPAFKKGSF